MQEEQVEVQQQPKKDWFSVWCGILFVVLILIDQITKIVADAYMDRGDSIPIIEGWLAITFTYNRGISYGLGSQSSPLLKIGVIALTAVMMAAITVFFFIIDKRRKWLRFAFVLVVAGGIGNLIDRVYYRVWDESTFPYGVRDMVDLSRFGFAVCNFADFFICGGAVMLMVGFFFFDQDAIFPQGKYKKLAEEAIAKEKQKEEEKRAQKQEEEQQAILRLQEERVETKEEDNG